MCKKIFFAVVFLAAVFSLTAAAAPEKTSSTAASVKGEISSKLDQIVKNDQQILKELEEIKKELYIVKIRASR